MTLQDKVENFFCQAEIILFTKVDNEIVMSLNYPKEKFSVFSNMQNYKDMKDYFTNRKITLRIIEQKTYYRASLIDMDNGEAININNVNFVTGNFDNFINSVPKDKKLIFVLYGLSKDGSTKVIQPPPPTSIPLEVHGYSFVYKKS